MMVNIDKTLFCSKTLPVSHSDTSVWQTGDVGFPQVRIERGVCLVRQYLPVQALANVDPVLEQNPRHPLALHVKVDILET